MKVLGRGSSAGKIARAVEDVTNDHNNNKKYGSSGFGFRGSVINMSLTCADVNALYDALKRAVDSGISVFAAAGNSNRSVRGIYPCSYTMVNCVGAIDRNY